MKKSILKNITFVILSLLFATLLVYGITNGEHILARMESSTL